MEVRSGIVAFEHQDGDSQSLSQPRPARTWAGHGSGAACNGCGNPIAEHEIEYEVELPSGSLIRSLHFHFTCYQGWYRGTAAARD